LSFPFSDGLNIDVAIGPVGFDVRCGQAGEGPLPNLSHCSDHRWIALDVPAQAGIATQVTVDGNVDPRVVCKAWFDTHVELSGFVERRISLAPIQRSADCSSPPKWLSNDRQPSTSWKGHWNRAVAQARRSPW
jgi:hypothetical protein